MVCLTWHLQLAEGGTEVLSHSPLHLTSLSEGRVQFQNHWIQKWREIGKMISILLLWLPAWGQNYVALKNITFVPSRFLERSQLKSIFGCPDWSPFQVGAKLVYLNPIQAMHTEYCNNNYYNLLSQSGFQVTVAKTNTKVRPITKGAKSTVNRSEFLEITCNSKREKNRLYKVWFILVLLLIEARFLSQSKRVAMIIAILYNYCT